MSHSKVTKLIKNYPGALKKLDDDYDDDYYDVKCMMYDV